jgi:hypothetical protein
MAETVNMERTKQISANMLSPFSEDLIMISASLPAS